MKQYTYTLDSEEQGLLEAYETGLVSEIPASEQDKQAAQATAKHTLAKTRNINIRISERDLRKLKVKAAAEGIPYQTLAASVLHKL
jgi:predicted DNA binding CopG/RHH family protein